MKNILEHLRRWAKGLKRQTMVLWYCYQHPQTPWLPKWISIFVVAYALSPIDLIPDFIPILGYLDDVIILPLGILLAVRLMPSPVLDECQIKAVEWEKNHVKRPVNKVAALFIVMIWLVALTGTWFTFAHR
ncbi:MAG: YkvA family protein [Pseudomonas fluorescens]